MIDKKDLYQQIILDHNRHPHNFKKLKKFSHWAKSENTLCGDSIEIFLQIDKDNVIKDIGFIGAGCAISKSSASIMTDMVKNRQIEDAKKLIKKFDKLTKNKLTKNTEDVDLQKLAVFSGIWQYPSRIKCVNLVWKTLAKALDK